MDIRHWRVWLGITVLAWVALGAYVLAQQTPGPGQPIHVICDSGCGGGGGVGADVNVTNTSLLVDQGAAGAGAWLVSGVVSGTVTANQGGTWTVQPGNTANTTAWLVTGTGGTFPISGSIANTSFTATQATGTNLHVVTDATSTTIATQATAANLNATVVGSGNFTVTQGTGTNLHTVVDSGTITAVTAITNALPAGNNNIGDVDIVTFPDNEPFNLQQVAGTTADTNSGVKSAGTLRVVLATDQPQLTNKLLVTPDSVALPANQSVNVAQVGGTNTVTGGANGTQGVGGINAQNAAITQNPLLGASKGIADGTQPTAVTDGNLSQNTGSLDGAQFVRFGGPVRWTCGLNGIAASLTQCQAAPGAGLRLYLTGVYVQTTTTTSGTYAIQTGTGSNCGTGTAALFPVSGTANRFNAPITTSAMAPIPFWVPLAAPVNSAICLIGVATNTISVQMVGYTAP